MKLGSLFDGSGGFPLAGVICGMTPVWASEIEKYPLKVTAARFPQMRQLGDVTLIDGAAIEPVDVITFGSPCQDLSVAGKQKGIHEGERSSLFFEAIRIIHEMREATDNGYPRYAVWENVPGAFSSNKGNDFRAVLQAFCDEAKAGVHVPLPKNGKWKHAGCIVGDGFSVAFRQYDAQFWGVPQRRKRIYLVADFASERAGEILFEREGMRWNPPQGGEAWQGVAEHAQGGAGGSGEVGKVGAFMGGQGASAGGIGYEENVAPTIKSVLSGSNTVPDVVYSIEGHVIDRETQQNGRGWAEGYAHTLNATDRHGICAIDCRNMRVNEKVSGTLQAKGEGGYSLNYQNPVVYSSGSHGILSEGVGVIGTGTRATYEMVAVYDTTQITSPGNYSKPMPGDACHPLAAQQHPPLAVYPEVTGALCANSHPGSYTGQDAFNDMLPVTLSEKPPRKYIVRRLTPLECCRLQGFPDWWEDGVEGSDSARYKMWGNGIALPCAVDVLSRLEET